MAGAPLSLPCYFDGMELGRDDFAAERDYFDAARTRANRSLHTWGIARGLEVTMVGQKCLAVTVGSGLAIDPNGREIVLSAPATASVPALGSRYANLFIRSDAVPAALSREAGTLGYKRIEYRPVVFFRAPGTGVEPDAVFLARATLDADGRIVQVEPESRRHCGFNLASLDFIDAQTEQSGATVVARADGGLNITAGRMRFAGSAAIAGGLAIGTAEPRALLDLKGGEPLLLSIRNTAGDGLLTVDQRGCAGICTAPGEARLTVSGGITLDGGRAIRFDGGGQVGTGADCGIRFGADSPSENPITLYASGMVKVLAGGSGTAALTVRSIILPILDFGSFDVWIGGDPIPPGQTSTDAVPPLLTVTGPVQSLTGGFQFKSDAVQNTAVASGVAIDIGTVVDWWPGPPDNRLALPAEFAVCDGRTIHDEHSPYHEKPLPDLIGRYVRGTASHEEIGATGGDKSHAHDVGTLPVHSHDFDHDHAAVAARTRLDTNVGEASDVGEQAGSPVGHDHGINLSLITWDGKTKENAAPSRSFATDFTENKPHSAQLVKIIRIK